MHILCVKSSYPSILIYQLSLITLFLPYHDYDMIGHCKITAAILTQPAKCKKALMFAKTSKSSFLGRFGPLGMVPKYMNCVTHFHFIKHCSCGDLERT